MLEGDFEEDTGSLFKALQNVIGLGDKARRKLIKLRLNLFIFLRSPFPKDPLYLLHQKIFEKNAEGTPVFL